MKALTPLRKYAWKVGVAPCLKAVECAFELLTPFLVRYVIDEGIGKNDWNLVLILALSLFGFAVIGFLCTMITQYLASRVSADYGYDLKMALYRHERKIGEDSLRKFGKDKTNILFTSDSYNVQNGVAMFMRLFVRSPFIIIGSLVLSFVIDTRAGFVFLAALLLCVVVLVLITVLSPRRYEKIQGGLDDMSLKAADVFSGAKPIRAYGRQEEEESDFEGITASFKKKNMSLAGLNAIVNPLTFFFLYGALVLVIYLGGLSLEVGDLTTGEVVSLVGYLTATLTALTMFSRLVNSINKAYASSKRIDEFFDLEEENPGTLEIKEEGSSLLSFDNVGFAYDGDPDHLAVHDLSFELKKGESLGVLGPTGSGKSTLALLLSRIYRPTEGKISFHGLDLSEIKEGEIRAKIALIPQKPAIYSGSVRYNLTLGEEGIPDEVLYEALRKSLAIKFVERYEDGLDHVLEEGGTNLSGGEKQRLSLARAFVRPYDVIVFDDCLSALDYLSEKEVRENIRDLKDTASLIVSQRTSSLTYCDSVLVMEKGEIVARGTHKELMESSTLYKEIHDIQGANR